MSDDCRDPLPVTPAHLAIGRPVNHLPESKEDSLEESSKRTVERYLYLQRLLNHYWKRWKREYLNLLSVRSKWQKESPSIREGDIVFFRVKEVHPGKNGLMRTVTVRAQKGVFNRLVQCLHRLEIDACSPTSFSRSWCSCWCWGEAANETLLIAKVHLFA